MALDLRVKRRRDSDSDGEIQEMNKAKSPRYSVKTYAFKIRHVCKDCEGILRLMKDQGDTRPLSNAKICPNCGHKAMHQNYYNLCSVCVRVLRRCAMCCSERNTDHIDPRDVILTSTMKSVLEIFPQPYQRILLRFIFKKWESFLGTENFPLEEFRRQFITIAYNFIDDIYMKQPLIKTPNLSKDQKYELINMQRDSAYRIAQRIVNGNDNYYQSTECPPNYMDVNIDRILRTNEWLQEMIKPLPKVTDIVKSQQNMAKRNITGTKSVQQQLVDIRNEIESVLQLPYNMPHNVSPSQFQQGSRSDAALDKEVENIIHKNYGQQKEIFIDLTASENNSQNALGESSANTVRDIFAAEEARINELSQRIDQAINAFKAKKKNQKDKAKMSSKSKSKSVASCSNEETKSIQQMNFANINVQSNKTPKKEETKVKESKSKSRSTKSQKEKKETTSKSKKKKDKNN